MRNSDGYVVSVPSLADELCAVLGLGLLSQITKSFPYCAVCASVSKKGVFDVNNTFDRLLSFRGETPHKKKLNDFEKI